MWAVGIILNAFYLSFSNSLSLNVALPMQCESSWGMSLQASPCLSLYNVRITRT